MPCAPAPFGDHEHLLVPPGACAWRAMLCRQPDRLHPADRHSKPVEAIGGGQAARGDFVAGATPETVEGRFHHAHAALQAKRAGALVGRAPRRPSASGSRRNPSAGRQHPAGRPRRRWVKINEPGEIGAGSGDSPIQSVWRSSLWPAYFDCVDCGERVAGGGPQRPCPRVPAIGYGHQDPWPPSLMTSGTQASLGLLDEALLAPPSWSPGEKMAQTSWPSGTLCFEAVVVAIEAGESASTCLEQHRTTSKRAIQGSAILVGAASWHVHLVPN